MTYSTTTDRAILLHEAYATTDLLTTRQRIHELFTIPKVHFPDWVLDRIAWRGNEHVLDIGSGSGNYVQPVLARIPDGRLIAGDLSHAMTQQTFTEYPEHPFAVNFDAQMIPFPDHTFDVVLANHMLFHVPDVFKSLVEIKRVLKPGGCMLASTNSQFNMPEIDQLIRRVLRVLDSFAPDIQPINPPSYTFTLENGTVQLARHFRAVARYDLPGFLIFPTVKPVLDYLNSTRPLREPQLPRRVNWDDFINAFSRQVQRAIDNTGMLRVNKLTGALVGTDGGDFAEAYLSRLNGAAHSAEHISDS